MDKGQVVFRTYTTLGSCIAALPEPVALGLGNVVGDVLFRVRHEHRAMVKANLRRVLGAEGDDAELLDRWAPPLVPRRTPATGSRGRGCRARRPTRSSSTCSWTASTTCTRGRPRARACILALPHIGSWEYGGAFLATQDLPMTAVAERIEPPELFDYFVEQRAAMGLTIVPLDKHSGSTLLSTLRGGGLVGLLCDRDIEGTGIEVEFFGERTTMPAGAGHPGPAHRSDPVHRCRLQRPGPRPPGHRRAAARHHPHRTRCGPTWPGSPRRSPPASRG